MARLTKRTVDAVRAGNRDVVIWDEALPGFGLRVKPSGVRSYLIQYRNAHGRSRRLTLGRHGVLTPDLARRAAQQVLATVASGHDPVASQATLRAAPTVDELLDRYVAEHVERHNRANTQIEVNRLIKRHIRPALGALKVGSVTRQDVANMHRAMAATPRQANFALAVCSKAFNLAEAWGMRSEGFNPCTKVAHYPERARERFLSNEELERLGAALRLAETEGLPWRRPPGRPAKDARKRQSKHERKPENQRTLHAWQVTAAIRLLLLTGCGWVRS